MKLTTKKTMILCLLLLTAVPLATVPLFAGDGAEEGSVDPDEAMAAMMAAATPGDHHKHLEHVVGKWDYTMKMWVDPSAPPTVEKGTMESKWILGGRYVESHYSGEIMGMPFEGQALDGYDNVKGQHTGVWVDNMSTTTMHFTGDCSDDHKTLTMSASFIDPATQQAMANKGVMMQVDENHFVYTSYIVMPDGAEMKGMELKATRRK